MWRTTPNLTIALALVTIVALATFPAATHQYTMCRGGSEGCLLMRNVLRDPLRLSNWKTSSLNRAISQLQAYQQLFDEDKRSDTGNLVPLFEI